MIKLFNLKFYRNTVVKRYYYIIRYKTARCMSINTDMATFESLKFDNLALRKLPIDPEDKNYVRTVNGACFSKVKPEPLINPSLVAWSPSAMELLDLSKSEMNRSDTAEYFSGNRLLPGSDPAAHCYCGHQFGRFAGQLGDGAAMYLGEVINNKNERWEIQLKGAGLTPYSRTADGRKVLRSTIREFLCSEAMHFLGIPTSRAGTCVNSDSKVVRDIFYDGNPKEENCAVVLRIAPTFIRFGSFEIFKTLDQMTGRFGPSVGRVDILHSLLDYVIDTFYHQISELFEDQQEKYAQFFKEVVLRTARLVADWQSVGFCHGVLNTDNMSIVGLTLDYGPFGFMDMYNPHHVCNSSDDNGRYTYIKQPEICLWNLLKLAESIQQAVPLDKTSPLLELYQEEYQSNFLKKMRAKLGIIATEFSDDSGFIEDLFNVMEMTGADFTNTFICLTLFNVNALLPSSKEILKMLMDNCYSLDVMISNHRLNNLPHIMPGIIAKLKEHPALITNLERAGIPVQRITSQMEKVEHLKTFTEESKQEYNKAHWDEWLGKYIKRMEADMKSYGGDVADYVEERLKVMTNSNPRFILRNHLLQEAIEKAEKGDYSQVNDLLDMLQKPYDVSYYEMIKNNPLEREKANRFPEQDASSSNKVYEKAPDWAFAIKVS